ncbi:alpha/beta fold hydrolase [Solicola gregarius]|uniref:Alpha/beta hydrolase n=1 Tax=Solicola gregarius TaxID=2908642 RepID=A0AA46TET3_9ACTN|nr:alpha/beta hydrolase [Solicola gregarius]UYM03830.1 alpha/beta hydrolase [Solicola gregarius]
MNLLTKRTLGISAALVGVAAAGVAAELVGRRRQSRRLEAGEEIPFGSLHSEPQPVVASDGVRLHVEVDEPDVPVDPAVPDGSRLRGSQAHSLPLTVVFAHGWVLDLDSWHFQRAALRGRVRMVFYDQRSHGRSQRSTRKGSNFDQLGRDLRDIIEATTPDGPVILVGHSMGGMTIMSLAEQFPDLVRERVAGVLLCGTSAGGLLPPGTPLRRAQPVVENLAVAITPMLAVGRRLGSNRSSRRFTVGPDAPVEYAEMTAQMLRRTHTHVLLDFLPNFGRLDAYEALAALPGEATVVVSGTHDQITPHKHSQRIVDRLPGARLVVADRAGHMVQLERHELVTAVLEDLIEQAVETQQETA